MHLVSLELYNFRQHRETRIEFLPGVTGIIGKNGCGKTTVLEAIGWALYGAPAVRGKNEDIRCRASEANAAVEVKLTFGLGPHVYVASRRIESSGKSTASLTIDGLPARTGFREVTDSVAKLLGMDYQAFFTSFFTGQKEVEFMRGMDGRTRAGAISRMLGYERLVKARERANQDRLGLVREIETLERGLADPNEIASRKKTAQSSVSAAEKSVDAAAKSLEKARKDVERLQPLRDLSEQKARRNDELSRRMELDGAEETRATVRVKEIEAELKILAEADAELTKLTPQVEEYCKVLEEYNNLSKLQQFESKRMEISGRLDGVEHDRESLQATIQELKSAPEELVKVDKTLTYLSKQIEEVDDAARKEREQLLTARNRTEAEIEQLGRQREEIAERRKTIQEAGQSGKCPTCERPLAEELPKVVAGFDSQLARIDAQVAKLSKKKEELARDPEKLTALVALKNTLEKEREENRQARERIGGMCLQLSSATSELDKKTESGKALKAELEKLPSGFDQERFAYLHKTGTQLRPVNERSKELCAALRRRGDLQGGLKREQEALARAKEQIRAAGEALRDLAFSQDEHTKLLADFEVASRTQAEAGIEVERAKGDLRAAQAALTAALADEKSYKSREAELKEKCRARLHLQTLSDAFDKLRTDLNNRAAPELAAAASDLLSDITDGRYTTLEVNEDYEATIRDDGELKPVISGGEEDVVNLSLRLAVSRMIADRAGQDLSLLILDEVFGSLDDIRRDNVVTLLQTLKNRFEQIVIITHIESIHDAVDNCIWIDFDEATKTSAVRAPSEIADCRLQIAD